MMTIYEKNNSLQMKKKVIFGNTLDPNNIGSDLNLIDHKIIGRKEGAAT